MAVTINGSTGVNYADNIKQKYGTGGDLEIYHNGSHSIIHDTGSGNLAVQTSAFTVANSANDETIFTAVADGAVTGYHNNSKKFETTSDGFKVSGALTKPTNPIAYAYLNGNSAVGGAGSRISEGNVAVFNATRLNVGSHYDTSNGRFTCPVDGIYEVNFETNLVLYNLTVGHWFQVATMKNGSRYYDNYDVCTQAAYQHFGFTNLVECSASDYLDIRFSSQSNNTFGADSNIYYNSVTFRLIQ